MCEASITLGRSQAKAKAKASPGEGGGGSAASHSSSSSGESEEESSKRLLVVDFAALRQRIDSGPASPARPAAEGGAGWGELERRTSLAMLRVAEQCCACPGAHAVCVFGGGGGSVHTGGTQAEGACARAG